MVEKRTNLAPGTKARLDEKAEREDRNFKLQDELAFRKATQGVPNQETLDKVLALGGDATRSSPVAEQQLPDVEPGLTTTTGAYRSPIDPTTAAVPASIYSDIARNVGGTPTVGSREHGVPEERWMKPEGGDDVIDRLNNLPDEEAWTKERDEMIGQSRGPDKARREADERKSAR